MVLKHRKPEQQKNSHKLCQKAHKAPANQNAKQSDKERYARFALSHEEAKSAVQSYKKV